MPLKQSPIHTSLIRLLARHAHASLIVCPLFLTGCGSLINAFTTEDKGIYGGVRWDLKTMVNPPSKECLPYLPMLVVDLPFSFTFDTLVVGEQIYRDLSDGPSVDPLKDWKMIPPEQNFREDKCLAKSFPFEDAIRDDVVAYLNQKAVSYAWDRETLTLKANFTGLSFREDGHGNRAVRIALPWKSDEDDMRIITLIYDSQGHRTQTLTWRRFIRRSMC